MARASSSAAAVGSIELPQIYAESIALNHAVGVHGAAILPASVRKKRNSAMEPDRALHIGVKRWHAGKRKKNHRDTTCKVTDYSLNATAYWYYVLAIRKMMFILSSQNERMFGLHPPR